MRDELNSFRYAAEGIVYAFRTQKHMRFHLAAALLAAAAAAWLGLSSVEWAILLVVMALVISLEMVNTAVELTIDRIGLERHPLAKAAKDTAAGAVLVASLLAAAIGFVLLGPPLWDRLFGG
ncbi:diacylglycerol kinase [Paenibacillus kobensis]|uniref:diacylglycerol kinase n=1 Tax=Paenibacillus kobensis TaxID=59841 RepID=UPI000FDC7FB1|nr:diacylglycerol kinase family protein [Paenibacillus kobensis]